MWRGINWSFQIVDDLITWNRRYDCTASINLMVAGHTTSQLLSPAGSTLRGSSNPSKLRMTAYYGVRIGRLNARIWRTKGWSNALMVVWKSSPTTKLVLTVFSLKLYMNPPPPAVKVAFVGCNREESARVHDAIMEYTGGHRWHTPFSWHFL